MPAQWPPTTTPAKPELILDRRMAKRHNKAVTQVLVKWEGCPEEDATWKYFYDLLKRFPKFNPWGQGFAGEGGIDTHENGNLAMIKGEIIAKTAKGQAVETKVGKKADLEKCVRKDGAGLINY